MTRAVLNANVGSWPDLRFDPVCPMLRRLPAVGHRMVEAGYPADPR